MKEVRAKVDIHLGDGRIIPRGTEMEVLDEGKGTIKCLFQGSPVFLSGFHNLEDVPEVPSLTEKVDPHVRKVLSTLITTSDGESLSKGTEVEVLNTSFGVSSCRVGEKKYSIAASLLKDIPEKKAPVPPVERSWRTLLGGYVPLVHGLPVLYEGNPGIFLGSGRILRGDGTTTERLSSVDLATVRVNLDERLGWAHTIMWVLREDPRENERYGWTLFLMGEMEPTENDKVELADTVKRIFLRRRP